MKRMIWVLIFVGLMSIANSTIIDFSTLPDGQSTSEDMEIHDEYASLGVLFYAPVTHPDADNNTSIAFGGLAPGGPNWSGGYGTYGGTLEMEFTTPILEFGTWIYDINPSARMNIYIYDTEGSEIYHARYSSRNFYFDYSSEEEISKVVLEGGKIYTSYYKYGWNYDGWHIDDLSYTPVPEPGTLALLTLGGLVIRKRK